MEDACVPLLVVLLVVHPIKMLNPLVTAFFLKWQPDRTTDPQTRTKDSTSLRQNRFFQPLASLQWPPPRVIRYAAPSGLTPPAPERKPQAVGGAQWGATGVPLHSLRCVVG